MTWTALTLLACLAGHPDRCHVYRLHTSAAAENCQDAARQWLARRAYLVPVYLACRDEHPA